MYTAREIIDRADAQLTSLDRVLDRGSPEGDKSIWTIHWGGGRNMGKSAGLRNRRIVIDPLPEPKLTFGFDEWNATLDAMVQRVTGVPDRYLYANGKGLSWFSFKETEMNELTIMQAAQGGYIVMDPNNYTQRMDGRAGHHIVFAGTLGQCTSHVAEHFTKIEQARLAKEAEEARQNQIEREVQAVRSRALASGTQQRLDD